MFRDTARDRSRLIQKRSKETHRAELDGKPEPHVIPTLRPSHLTIGIVEVEVPCELVLARLTRIPAISPFLLSRQK